MTNVEADDDNDGDDDDDDDNYSKDDGNDHQTKRQKLKVSGLEMWFRNEKAYFLCGSLQRIGAKGA